MQHYRNRCSTGIHTFIKIVIYTKDQKSRKIAVSLICIFFFSLVCIFFSLQRQIRNPTARNTKLLPVNPGCVWYSSVKNNAAFSCFGVGSERKQWLPQQLSTSGYKSVAGRRWSYMSRGRMGKRCLEFKLAWPERCLSVMRRWIKAILGCSIKWRQSNQSTWSYGEELIALIYR